MPRSVSIKTKREAADYRIVIACGSLNAVGERANALLGPGRRIAIVSNRRVFGLYGEKVVKSLETAGFRTSAILIGDGERYKNLRTLQSILDSLSTLGISRTDAVVGLGGGVVGDIASFAAAIHLRGIDFFQIPTTLLAIVDSSVGGKTGINTAFGKNLVGAFAQPKGVFIDPQVLVTLPKRELTAGLCECVKHAAISGEALFDRAAKLIDRLQSSDLAKLLQTKTFTSNLELFLKDQIKFKANIVKGDERESAARLDAKSRKILNFGHTFAHALERASDYRYLKHGEAVGYGIIFAASLSEKLGLLDRKVVNLLRDVVYRAGDLPRIDKVDSTLVFESIRHDKKNVGNTLQWVLLKAIGKPVIVSHSEIGDRTVRQLIKQFIASN